MPRCPSTPSRGRHGFGGLRRCFCESAMDTIAQALLRSGEGRMHWSTRHEDRSRRKPTKPTSGSRHHHARSRPRGSPRWTQEPEKKAIPTFTEFAKSGWSSTCPAMQGGPCRPHHGLDNQQGARAPPTPGLLRLVQHKQSRDPSMLIACLVQRRAFDLRATTELDDEGALPRAEDRLALVGCRRGPRR